MSKKRSVVAVIDDNVGILGAMARFLSALGYETELYASADEFLDVAIMTEAICLIIDVQIGEDSGIDLAIRVAKQGITMPVIFMSADHAESVKKRATEIGCIAFLDKPFSADALIAALSKLPDRTPWNSAWPQVASCENGKVFRTDDAPRRRSKSGQKPLMPDAIKLMPRKMGAI
jgi:FixJ family two-component response regulator